MEGDRTSHLTQWPHRIRRGFILDWRRFLMVTDLVLLAMGLEFKLPTTMTTVATDMPILSVLV